MRVQQYSPNDLMTGLKEIVHRHRPQYCAIAPDFPVQRATRYAGGHSTRYPLPFFDSVKEAFESAKKHGVSNVSVGRAIDFKDQPFISKEGLKELGWMGVNWPLQRIVYDTTQFLEYQFMQSLT